MVGLLVAAALAAQRLPSPAASPARRRARHLRRPGRRHHHLSVRHLPRARRQVRMVQRRRSRRLRPVERAGARNLVIPEDRVRQIVQATRSGALPDIGHALGLFPCKHAHGDQCRQVAGHAGRQRRRHGASPTPPKPRASRSRASKRSNPSSTCSPTCRRRCAAAPQPGCPRAPLDGQPVASR